jgi:hypothetical protein
MGSIDNVYAKLGVQNHTSEFFLLDVVHNRKKHVKGEGVPPLAERDPDEVTMATACDNSDMENKKDAQYRSVVDFLPGAGVFYPRMPPDFVRGKDINHWPAADRAREYNQFLVSSNSARVGGRNYSLR